MNTEPDGITAAARRAVLVAVGAGAAAGLVVVAQGLQIGAVVDRALAGPVGTPSLTVAALVLTGLAVARAALLRLADGAGARAADLVRRRLRRRAVSGLIRRGPAALGHERVGELVQTLTSGLDALDPYVAHYLPHLALAALVPGMVVCAVFLIDPLSAVVLLITGPLMPVFMWLAGSSAQARAQTQWVTMARLSARFLDAIRSVGMLRTFGAAAREADILDRHGRQVRDATMIVLRIAFLSGLILEWLATIGVALVAVEVGLRLLYGRVDFRAAFTVLVLAPEFYRPLRTLAASFHAGLSGREAVARATALAEPRSANTGQSFTESVPPKGVAPLTRVHRRVVPAIAFRSVSYRYVPDAPVALDAVSFTMPAGQTLALVGPAGAGKSTAGRLLLGFIVPQSGTIEADGVRLTPPGAARWRHRVAWVPQDPSLAHGSVLDNLRLANADAGDAQVEAALDRARALDFVRALPRGLHTPLGERGERLSSGQVQRLAIARAFLKDAPVVVLDEPTAFLDPESDAQVSGALDQLRQNRTVLLISHRLTSLLRTDTLVVLQHGRVTEQGPPDALRTADGPFAALCAASRSDA